MGLHLKSRPLEWDNLEITLRYRPERATTSSHYQVGPDLVVWQCRGTFRPVSQSYLKVISLERSALEAEPHRENDTVYGGLTTRARPVFDENGSFLSNLESKFIKNGPFLTNRESKFVKNGPF